MITDSLQVIIWNKSQYMDAPQAYTQQPENGHRWIITVSQMGQLKRSSRLRAMINRQSGATSGPSALASVLCIPWQARRNSGRAAAPPTEHHSNTSRQPKISGSALCEPQDAYMKKRCADHTIALLTWPALVVRGDINKTSAP